MHANCKAAILMGPSSLLFSAQPRAATVVYVSNAEDGEIGTYTLRSDGSLQPGPHFAAEKLVMPMTVSPDKRFLIAGVRSKPFSAYTYGIDRRNGSLKLVGTGPLAESFPHISLDRTGRFLLRASYRHPPVTDHPASALPPDSKLVPGAPRPSPGRNTDNDIWASDLHLTPNGRFLYAAERTSSSIGAFRVDAATGSLAYLGSTPTEKQPRGFRIDPTGRFMVVSGEKSET